MRYWIIVALLAIYLPSWGSSRRLPDAEYPKPIYETPCPLASMECCIYPVTSRKYQDCCEQHGCCQCDEYISHEDYHISEDCTSAWECCRFEFLSREYQQCCTDHGCCPNCRRFWSDQCWYNDGNYTIGSVVEHMEGVCMKLQCVAEISSKPPYMNAVVTPIFYEPGPYDHHCTGSIIPKCVDMHGIVRAEGEEWFMSATCEQCLCHKGKIGCRPVRRPCPPAPYPNCRAVQSGGCCPIWDCGSVREGCMSNDGIHRQYGETWWDVDNPCVYKKCTMHGVLKYDKECIPEPPPHPSCKLVRGDGECCEEWRCGSLGMNSGGNCPDPNSFGRFCIQYFDQCNSDEECGKGAFCCLVAGCGRECMNTCIDDGGVGHSLGEVWSDPLNANQMLTCLENGIHSVPPLPGLEPWLPGLPNSLADCLSSGLNLTNLGEDLITLSQLTNVLPLKPANFYVSGYQELVKNRDAVENLNSEDISTIESLAGKFDWSSVLPVLKQNTTKIQRDSLSIGDGSLRVQSTVAQIISRRNDTLEQDSASLKHQVAFKRTDPLATKMAQLGVVMKAATAKFLRSVNLPSSASGALTLFGDAFDCTNRFKSFLRPPLAPPCDPKHPFRTMDGSCNNLRNDLWGAAFTKFRRILGQDYGDDISSLRLASDGTPLPSARLISSKINTKASKASSLALLHMTYGQFVDHDLTATPIAKGYLGGSIKCCDDLRVKLSLAISTLNSTTVVVEELRETEPTLTTTNTLGELQVTLKLLKELQISGADLFTTSSTDARTLRQVTQQFEIGGSKISIPLRPQSAECAPISIPHNDPFYSCHGQLCMEFVRSVPAPVCSFGPREQMNQNSAYLDGSVIYGVKKEHTDSLRSFTDGLLKIQVTLDNQILLHAEDDRHDGCNVDPKYNDGEFCFKAGDGRVNEQVLLTMLQTVWAREHNRVAKILSSFNNKGWDDERLFQETRRIVVAELQHVTYNEFLPTILGSVMMNILELKPKLGSQYTMDYQDTLEASIANSFATAAYRFGHSEIADFMQKINKHGMVHTEELSSLFFNPFSMYMPETVEDLARGGTSYRARKVDAYFTEEVAGKLFRGNKPYGLDLVALNIQRGRDHGIPGYAQWRTLCGPAVNEFSDLNSVIDSDIVDTFKELYTDVEDIDLYIGGIAERPFLDGILGPTFSCIIADQFLRIKKGDRFWYEYEKNTGGFSKEQLKQLHKVTLARILCNNIPELNLLQPEPLKEASQTNMRVPCSSLTIPSYSLQSWKV